MGEKLNKKDYKLIFGCVILSIIFVFLSIKYFYKAHPEASIEFKVTREKAKTISEKFLSDRGINISEFRYASIFDYDGTAKVYLERELGLTEANKIMGKTVRLWVWKNRYFVPLKKEEFNVDVTTKGEIVGFSHLIEEEKEAPYITEEEAKSVATHFIQNTIKIDTNELEFLSSSIKKLPKRTDYEFLWKKFDIKDAEYRIKITVQGDQVGEYKEYLHVPEKWKRDYEKLRSLNETAGMVATLFVIFIGIGLLFTIIVKSRKRDVKWKTAAIFGIIAFILQLLGELNILPLDVFYYNTADSYSGFLGTRLFYILLSAIAIGIFIFVVTAGSEPIYRENYKNKVSISNLFRWRSFTTKNFFIELIVGFTLGFFFIAYQIFFYILAYKLGAWAPADIPYSDILTTRIPWIYVLLIGFLPAVSEEFIFRAFSIPFIKKITKSTFIAIILASFIWGFGHANYPQQPFYIRGIECGLAGILTSIIMLKFSILSCLVWHYSVNAFYTAFLLLRSDNTYFITTGALCAGILFIPLIICVIYYIKNKKFNPIDELTNEKEGVSYIVEKEEKPEVQSIIYEKIPYKKKIIVSVVAGVLLLSFLIKKEKVGDFIQYKITKDAASEKAKNFMKEKGIDVSEYKEVAFLHSNFDKYAAKYILDREGVSGVNKIYSDKIKSALWCIRYFKPLQKEEYKVYIDSKTGEIYNFEHIIPEEKEGAELSKEEAINIATDFLKSKSINLEDYELKEVLPEKRKNRLDYTIVWEEKKGIEEARVRIKVNIQGNEVSNFNKFVKIPEEWERQRKKTTIFDVLRNVTRFVFIFFICIYGVILLFKEKAKGILWKKAILISFIFVFLFLLHQINSLPIRYKDYSTAIELNIFNTISIIGIITSMIAIFILSVGCIKIITIICPDWVYAFHKENRANLSTDAIFCSIITLLWILPLTHISEFILYKMPKLGIINNLPLPSHIDKSVPFISLFNDIVMTTLLITTALCIAIALMKKIKNSIFIIILGILAMIGFTDGKNFNEVIFNFLILGIKVLPIIFLIKYIYKNNLIAYPLSFFIILSVLRFYPIYAHSAYKIDSLFGLFIPIIIILWLLLQTTKKIYLKNS